MLHNMLTNAKADFERMIQLDSTSAEAYVDLGRVLIRTKQKRAARESLLKAAKYQDKLPENLRRLLPYWLDQT